MPPFTLYTKTKLSSQYDIRCCPLSACLARDSLTTCSVVQIPSPDSRLPQHLCDCAKAWPPPEMPSAACEHCSFSGFSRTSCQKPFQISFFACSCLSNSCAHESIGQLLPVTRFSCEYRSLCYTMSSEEA